mmetsp:Transcript_57735/g.160975  ORF Transcript_57735/g.160975 Transcript_57735/m.160975 type:complete len:234 (+) Transcript_57735:629-1330(+)
MLAKPWNRPQSICTGSGVLWWGPRRDEHDARMRLVCDARPAQSEGARSSQPRRQDQRRAKFRFRSLEVCRPRWFHRPPRVPVRPLGNLRFRVGFRSVAGPLLEAGRLRNREEGHRQKPPRECIPIGRRSRRDASRVGIQYRRRYAIELDERGRRGSESAGRGSDRLHACDRRKLRNRDALLLPPRFSREEAGRSAYRVRAFYQHCLAAEASVDRALVRAWLPGYGSMAGIASC